MIAGPFSKPKPVSPFRAAVQPLFVLGTLLLLIGSAVMVGAWPETRVYGTFVSKSGSEGGVFLGAVMAGVGQVLLAIAIIACGVHVGTKSRVVPDPS